MKMSVVYHSVSGNTEKMAQAIIAGAQEVGGVEAKAFSFEAIDGEFLKDSKCVVFGTPTYLANMSGAVKAWLDGPSMGYGLAGKLAGAYATADYLHGGGEIAIQTILSHVMVLGMLPYSGGGSQGKPVIHLGPVAFKDKLDELEELFKLYGRRMAEKAAELFG